jgi:hypothetical protein
MTTPYLHGNWETCTACNGTGQSSQELFFAREFEAKDGRRYPSANIYASCKTCKGTCRVAVPKAEIVRRTCIEARRLYWPQFTERTTAHG